jgi:serine/threonine protein kinase
VSEREVARGGMGRIIAAHDRILGRPVALKELLHADAEHAARFRREALITARLQHPAIVPVYQAGRWPSGEPFYAMKLVSGRPLDRAIADATTLSRASACCRRSSPRSTRSPTPTPSASSTAISSRPTCWSATSARSS